MKKIISLILFVIISYNSFSQCKFKKDEYDEFTKNKVRETKPFVVAGGFSQSYGFAFKQVNDFYYIQLSYSTLGSITMMIEQGNELMIKLQNDSVLHLSSVETQFSKIVYNSSVYSTYIVCNYSITKENMEHLSKIKSVKIRFYTSEGYFEKEINDQGDDRILKNSQCILN